METLLKCSEELDNGSDMRPFVVLAELFLVLLNDQKSKYTKDTNEDLKLLTEVESLLKTTTNCYNEMHKRAKDSVLAITIKTLELESDELQNNSDLAQNFVRFNVEILCNEFFVIENQISNGMEIEGMSINLMKQLLLLNGNEVVMRNWDNWFNHHKIFNRLMSIISTICQSYNHRSITSDLLDLLVLFAKGAYSKELINCDLGEYLWMKLVPPKELIDRHYGETKTSNNSWTAQEWWIIYSKGIQLVKQLLEKHSYLFIKDALFFVGIHEEYLTDCIMLAKSSLEPNAMKLIKITLELISEVVSFEGSWRIDYFQSIMSLMRCVQNLLDTSVSLLHRPKILKRLTETSKAQLEEYTDIILTDPSDELVSSMNELIEIVTLCAKCLLQFSPKLLQLLCDVEFQQNKWIPFIEVQFGAPKINGDSFQQLSFGTVLSAIALLVKSLNLKHYAFKQEPLNQLPTDNEKDGGNLTATMASFSETAHHRNSSYSLGDLR